MLKTGADKIVHFPHPEILIPWDDQDCQDNYYIDDEQWAESHVAGAVEVATEILEEKPLDPWNNLIQRQAASFLNRSYIQGYLAALNPDPNYLRLHIQTENRTKPPYQECIRELLSIPLGHYVLIKALHNQFGDYK